MNCTKKVENCTNNTKEHMKKNCEEVKKNATKVDKMEDGPDKTRETNILNVNATKAFTGYNQNCNKTKNG